MLRKIVCVALLSAAATLLTASSARAWGAYHVGYTHVGPYGVQHYGRTVGVGPYGGVYGGARYGSAYGGYRYGYGGYDRYGYGGAYRYGGYDRYGGAYRYGAYRGW